MRVSKGEGFIKAPTSATFPDDKSDLHRPKKCEAVFGSAYAQISGWRSGNQRNKVAKRKLKDSLDAGSLNASGKVVVGQQNLRTNVPQKTTRALTILGLLAVIYTSIVAALHQLSPLVLDKTTTSNSIETILTAMVFLGVIPAFYIVVKSPWTRSAAAVVALICTYPITGYLAHEIVQRTQPPGLNKFSLFDALWGLSSLFSLIILTGYSVYQMNERAKRKLADKA